MTTLPLTLASGSPYRKQQLEQQLQLTLKNIAPDIDETPIHDEHPKDCALRLSQLKAEAISHNTEKPSLIIAGDQTAALGTTLLHKPLSRAKAIAQLQAFAGNTVVFYSGVCVLNSQTGAHLKTTVETHVKFRQLTDNQIEHYVDHDPAFDCVGAFKNESLGIALCENITSNDPSALTGLPLITLTHMLAEMGFDLLAPRS